jgi:hypothetical protein
MATRHLYEMEDVAAHLLYAIAHGDGAQAAHAARELHASEEDELLYRLLTLAWMLAPAGAYERAIADGFEARDTDAMLRALAACATPYELPPTKRAPRADPPPADYDAPPPPPAWNRHPTGWTPAAAGALWHAIDESLRKHNPARAFRLTAQLIVGNTVSLAQLLTSVGIHAAYGELLLQTVYEPLCERILYHAIYATTAPPVAPPVAPPAGGKSGRVFKISADALAAWSVRSKPLTRLMGAPLLVAADDACAYWRRLCRNVRVVDDNLVFADDDACETFYNTYFPDDIPDEWSVHEREKSHGLLLPSSLTKNPWVAAFLLCWA